jgi:amino acid transporter
LTRAPLERVIGVGGLSGSAVNCIVGSGIFGLPGIAAAMLGRAAVLVAKDPCAGGRERRVRLSGE